MRICSIDTICPICFKHEAIVCFGHEVDAYNQGADIQNAFKSLDKVQREQLLSGICGPCWTAWSNEMDAQNK